MGYTHYYRCKPEIDPHRFRAFIEDVKKIYAYPGVRDLICADSDEPETEPEVTEDFVLFNGKGPDGHESFYLTRINERQSYEKGDDPYVFNFTKTAHKPYDAVVCCVLIAARERLQDDVKISSDGDWADWLEGRMLYKEVFGGEAQQPFPDREK